MSQIETKKTPAIAFVVNAQAGVLKMTFADGSEYTVTLSELTPDLYAMAALHGLKQKLGDAGAMSRDPETGRSATIADKKAAVLEVFERITSGGDWNKGREAGGDGVGNGGLLFKALCRLYAMKAPEEIRAYLADKTAAQQAALRTNARIAPIIDAIRAESAKGIDSDELLDGLEG